MKAVILAAGKGSRLGKLRSYSSKPTLPVLGKALITHVYESLASLVDTIILVVSPDDEGIHKVLTDDRWLLEKVVRVEQERPLGSADALRHAWPYVNGPCVVASCDNLMSTDYLAHFIQEFNRNNSTALLSIAEYEPGAGLPGSVADIDEGGRVNRLIEKPRQDQLISEWTALPLYAFRPTFARYLFGLELSNRNEYEIPQAIQNLIDRGGAVHAVKASGRITVNTPYEYLEAIRELLDKSATEKVEDGTGVAGTAAIRPPVYIESSVKVAPEATVGPYVYMMRGSRVERGATVANSVLFPDAKVVESAEMNGKIVFTDGVIDLQKPRGSRGQAHHPLDEHTVG